MSQIPGQAPTETPPGGAPPADPPAGTAPEISVKPPDGEPKTFDAEYVSKLRSEAASHRTELKKTQDELKKLQDAQLSEQEKTAKRATDAEALVQATEAKLRERTVRAEVKLAAQAMGVVDPDAAYRLLELDQITFNDDGEPTNIEKLLKDMAAKRPYLLGGGTGSSATNPGGGHGKGTLTRDDIKKMSPAEINSRWDEVQKVLSSA